MDLGSLIAAALLSLGLIGTDAVLNSGTINFDIQVTEDLAKKGYTVQLVDALMDNDLKELVEFKSIVHPPQIRSAQQKSIVGAVAGALNLKEVTQAFQADFGMNPVLLSGSLMAGGVSSKEYRFVLAGESRHTGSFTIDATSGDLPLPQFLQSMALQVVAYIEPYAAAVRRFDDLNQALNATKPETGHQEFRAYVENLMASEAGATESAVDHAAFHNLLGLSSLMFSQPDQAEQDFQMAATLDPEMGIPLLNMALLRLSQHRYDETISLAQAAMKTHMVAEKPKVLANAYTAMALALWGKKDLDGANKQFLAAVDTYPATLWGYFYWAEFFEQNGDKNDAEYLRGRAQHNLSSYESYPEVGFLHLRVLTDKGFALQPIDLAKVRHVTEIYAQNGPILKVGP